MEISAATGALDRAIRQRNLFILLTLILAVTTLLTAARAATSEQKIILVPGLAREMSLGESKVSQSYLEETALSFFNLLLDISPSDMEYKRQTVLKYTSRSDSAYVKAVNNYFASAREKYRNFDLATHFTVKTMRVDLGKNEVIAEGILTAVYGKKGYHSEEASYKASFEYSGGFLRLREFVKITEEEAKSEAK